MLLLGGGITGSPVENGIVAGLSLGMGVAGVTSKVSKGEGLADSPVGAVGSGL
jgi:hypothetical protein